MKSDKRSTDSRRAGRHATRFFHFVSISSSPALRGILSVLLAVACVIPLAGCGGGGTPDTTSGAGTEAPGPDTQVPDSSSAEPATSAPAATTSKPDGTSAPAVTTAAPEATTDAEGRSDYPVEGLTWSLGYVGSSTHSSWKNTLNPTGAYYSVSAIFTVPAAGSTVTFTDDNTNSNGDSNFASAAAYVFSSWKDSGSGNWVIDLDGYNASGTDVSYTDAGGARTYTYTTKKDNESLRISFRSGESTSFVPSKYPTVTVTGKAPATVPSQQTVDPNAKNDRLFDLAAWTTADRSRAYYENLRGLTVNFIGDSYFAGDGIDSRYVWPALLGLKYDMTVVNQGKNGSSISDYDSSKNPICRRYTSLPANNPDIVVLQGGKNDYNVSCPLGAAGSTDTKTFRGAVRTTIEGLRKKYPSAVIICVTPWEIGSAANGIGLAVRDYGNAMIAVCEEMGVPCINAMSSESGIIMTDASFRNQYCRSSGDISHLNAEGHALALKFFEKQISEKFGQPGGSTTPEVTLPSEITTSPAEITTSPAEVTTSASVSADDPVALRWHLGYVGSSSHSTYKNKLNTTGSMYSFSEIFTIPKAGSTVTFTDDNTNSNGDSNFASAAAYVFSSWKEESPGVWVIDTDGYNVSGTEATYTESGGARTYTYTTTKDNENIRISFRSGQSSSFVPSDYPAVMVTGGEPAHAVSDPAFDALG